MIYKFRKIASITSLPLQLDEVKDFLKITGEAEDKVLKRLIKSVVDSCEAYTGKVLLTRNMVMELRNFTSSMLILPVQPVNKINSIKLINYYGKEAIFDSEYYKLNENTSIVYFKHNPLSHRVVIDFDAGMGDDSTDLAEDVKIALLKHVAFLYLNRGQNREYNLNQYRKFKIIKI